MSHEVKIHTAQTKILRELLFLPNVNFIKLQKITGLASDHVKFHIKHLVQLELVTKSARGVYALTTKGKEYANRLDTDSGTIERQPKSAVILIVEKIENNVTKYLVQQRLKHPYYGFWGLPSGKIRWGETIFETASRELQEEAGLDAEFEFRGLYHEHVRHAKTGEILEDKIFHMMLGKNITGELKETFEGGRNVFTTRDEFLGEEKKYKSCDIEMSFVDKVQLLVEEVQIYDDKQF